MADRVMISCRHVHQVYDLFADRFEGIEVDFPHFRGQQLDETELLGMVNQYDGVLLGDDHFTARVIEAAPRLRVISKWGIGIDSIDTDAAKRRNIPVYNTPGVFGEELADYALGYLLLLARRQHQVDAATRRGEWQQVRGRSLQGVTAGLVGFGSSGKAFARRLFSMGLTILVTDLITPTEATLSAVGAEFVSFETLLSRSQVISLHLPSTQESRHIVDRAALAAMRDGVWLINTARGALIDESALCDALTSGKVGAAALDVFESEPLPASARLRDFDQVVFGAHNGSNTHEAVLRTTDRAIANLLEGLSLDRNGG